jgi:hypothetical protein
VRVVRPSSIEEYASWYLYRERGKNDRRPVPAAPRDQVETMRERHGHGKMRSWFTDSTRWHIVLLDLDDLGNLVFLESAWTKDEGLVVPDVINYRVLERVAQNAMAGDYFSRPTRSTRSTTTRSRQVGYDSRESIALLCVPRKRAKCATTRELSTTCSTVSDGACRTWRS